MNTTFSTSVSASENAAGGSATLNVTLILLFSLIIIAGVTVLQIYLSKKENKWTGLILPFISFTISLTAVFAVLLFSTNTGIMTLTGTDSEIIRQTPTRVNSTAEIIQSVVYIFILYNIPTVILLAIRAACRNKKNQQRALEKMSIQDLE